jgi:hypothetical protein
MPPSPPSAPERSLRVTGSIERIELSNVLVRQGKSKICAFFAIPLAVPRLRDRRNAALDAPTEEHLGGRPPETMRDPSHRLAREVATGPERAVRHERDPLLATRVEESLPVLKEVELIQPWPGLLMPAMVCGLSRIRRGAGCHGFATR